jgi:release factor glutamine methyltransferase
VSQTPRLDAEVLLAASTGVSRSRVAAFPEQEVVAASRHSFERVIRARADGVPVAYLTGYKEFYSLGLEVTPAVLIPRPETELLVEQALRRLPEGESTRVLDLGTGSGAIALALKQERPGARVTAVDVSAAALEVARANARRLELDVEWRRSNWFDALEASERFELIAANPPYVESNDAALAGPLRHEPRRALDGGADGLAALRHIVGAAARHLAPGGWLLVEHGAMQRRALLELAARTATFAHVEGYADLAGHDRVLALRVS